MKESHHKPPPKDIRHSVWQAVDRQLISRKFHEI